MACTCFDYFSLGQNQRLVSWKFHFCFYLLYLNIHTFSLDLGNMFTRRMPVSVGVSVGRSIVMWAQGSFGSEGGDAWPLWWWWRFYWFSSLGLWVLDSGVTLTGVGYLWNRRRCSTHSTFPVVLVKQQLIMEAIPVGFFSYWPHWVPVTVFHSTGMKISKRCWRATRSRSNWRPWKGSLAWVHDRTSPYTFTDSQAFSQQVH